MDRAKRKIFYVVLVVVGLPTLIFSLFEAGSLKENEKVIETIYANQLDAILYSVNQYSEDAISSWINSMNLILKNSKESKTDELNAFILENPAIHCYAQLDDSFKYVLQLPFDSEIKNIEQEIVDTLLNNKDILDRQRLYFEEGGYRKIETFSLSNDQLHLLVFYLEPDTNPQLQVIIINPQSFIIDVLDPKIQEVAQDKFYIGAFYGTDKNIFYNSDKQYTPLQFEHKKSFWFLSDIYLGIELKDQTIQQLIRQRKRKNVFLIMIIDLTLLFGAWLIFRNINRQIELTRIKSDFISNVSHEIRTPLALISMYVETLEMERVKTEKKKKEYYAVINQETHRLSNMVNKILNFSQIENKQRKYSFASVDINEAITEVIDTFRFHLELNDFAVNLNLEKNLPHIRADRDAIVDVIINLVDNAVKYSTSVKFIKITTGRQNNGVFVEVADKGIGISESDQKKVYEKFFRVTKKDIANKAKGTGLGLTIVKHIVDVHNGGISIKSKLNEGAVFRIEFPINT